jgi:uncharacterized protein YjbI with pentapeptide repeats
MNEQDNMQATTLQRPMNDDKEAWKAYWNQKNQPWRTEPEIDEKRQAELTRLRAIVPDIKKGIYPFRDIKLSRADIEWLLAMHNNGQGPLVWSYDDRTRGKGLDLRGADLRSVDLQGLPLASLVAGLNRSDFIEASSEERRMAIVHLEDANLSYAHLEGADLIMARLEGADLFRAHLEDADIFKAHLEGASLKRAFLGGASLRCAFLDVGTDFDEVKLEDERLGCVWLADIHWGGANYTRAGWAEIKVLGDEIEASRPTRWDGKEKSEYEILAFYHWAVRANRQVAAALQAQGLNEEAAHFSYRAQVLQRKVAWRQKKIGQYLLLAFLGLLAGYGYKLWRSFVTYVLVIGLFALAYYLFGPKAGVSLSPLEAVVFSMTSFHGRGFFPGGDIRLSNPIVVLAALQAFVGLIIEVTFIATLTQRLFRK